MSIILDHTLAQKIVSDNNKLEVNGHFCSLQVWHRHMPGELYDNAVVISSMKKQSRSVEVDYYKLKTLQTMINPWRFLTTDLWMKDNSKREVTRQDGTRE